jgi:anaerobic selenocysteine-containing dehydrogenase
MTLEALAAHLDLARSTVSRALSEDANISPPNADAGAVAAIGTASRAYISSWREDMETIRAVCGHDCPDLCSLLVQVENGRVVQVRGDPDHPFTAGFACAKTNRDAELVNSPERLTTPLRRIGPKGAGEFVPISWDDALEEITARFHSIIAESGARAILGYAYSAHTGVMNRGLLNGVFHALGTSRLDAGTVCDSCSIEAWNATVGPIGGADPESVTESDLLVSWGCDLVTTNVHFWAKIVQERKRGLKVVVIDPRRSRTAQNADWHLPIRIGTDAALALGIMHILVRDGLCDRTYIAEHTVGFERLEREVLPRFAPQRVAAITGLKLTEIERFAALYGGAKSSFIRLGEGMTRLANGGQALRAVASLPGLTGAYGRRGGGSLLYTGDFGGFDSDAVGKPSGPNTTRTVNHLRLGEALLQLTDPPIRALFVASNNPAVTCPDAGKVRRWYTIRSCRSRHVMLTSCCRRRSISKRRTCIVRTAPIICSTRRGRWRRAGRHGRIFALRRHWPEKWD